MGMGPCIISFLKYSDFTQSRVMYITILGLIVLYLIGRIIINLFFHPLSKFPGPKWVAATHIPYLRQLLKGKLTFWVHELHERYGDVVRISPNELSYRTPQSWKDIYGSRVGHTLLPKDPNFYRAPPGGIHSIITAPHKEHQGYRRLLSHAFSERALREQEPLMKVYVDLLIAKLHKRVDEKRLDMVDWYNWTTFDLIGDLSFGESFGCLEAAQYHPWVEMLFSSIKMTVLIAAAAVVPFGMWLLAITVGVKGMKIRQTHMDLTIEKVSKRLEAKTDRNDFMQYILRENANGLTMSKEEIMATCWHLIIAGSETTATLLSGATYYLLRNPDAMKKLKEEIRTTFQSEDQINIMNVSGLKYMLACLDEAMRLYPPVSGGLPRSVPRGGEVINGEFIPESILVSTSHWSAYQSGTYWQDPLSFVPERWLSDQRFASDVKSVFQPFSYGPRNCIGRNLAYAEMRLIMARLIWNFDMELCKESENWTDQKVFVLWDKNPLWVKLSAATRE